MKHSTFFKIRKVLWYIVATVAICSFIYLASEPGEDIAIIEFVPGKIVALVVLFCCGVFCAILDNPNLIMRHFVAIACVMSAWAYKHLGIRNEMCKWAHKVERNKGYTRFYIWTVRRYDKYASEKHVYENVR